MMSAHPLHVTEAHTGGQGGDLLHLVMCLLALSPHLLRVLSVQPQQATGIMASVMVRISDVR